GSSGSGAKHPAERMTAFTRTSIRMTIRTRRSFRLSSTACRFSSRRWILMRQSRRVPDSLITTLRHRVPTRPEASSAGAEPPGQALVERGCGLVEPANLDRLALELILRDDRVESRDSGGIPDVRAAHVDDDA